MEIANFSIGKGPPCEYFQHNFEVSFDFSAIFRKKYKGLLFENILWKLQTCDYVKKYPKGVP